MNVGKTLFAQLMEFVPWTSIARIVHRYDGDSGVRRLSCAEQFRVMAFCAFDLARIVARHRSHAVGQRDQALCDGFPSCHQALDAG